MSDRITENVKIERLTAELSRKTGQLAECRKLLRELLQQPEATQSVAGVPRRPDRYVWDARWVRRDVLQAALRAAGGDDE